MPVFTHNMGERERERGGGGHASKEGSLTERERYLYSSYFGLRLTLSILPAAAKCWSARNPTRVGSGKTFLLVYCISYFFTLPYESNIFVVKTIQIQIDILGKIINGHNLIFLCLRIVHIQKTKH